MVLEKNLEKSKEGMSFKSFFFYTLVNGFLVKIVFVFLFFLLSGIYLDSLFFTKPTLTLLGIFLGMFIIIWDGYKSLKEILKELETTLQAEENKVKINPQRLQVARLLEQIKKKYAYADNKIQRHKKDKHFPIKKNTATFQINLLTDSGVDFGKKEKSTSFAHYKGTDSLIEQIRKVEIGYKAKNSEKENS